MAHWVAQSDVPSITAATRRRTAYMLGLRPRVEAAIQNSLARNPRTEEVTLDVLAEFDPRELANTSTRSGMSRLKQDFGLLIAQTLVDLKGAMNVETLRRDDGRAVSSRRNTRSALTWVSNYAPHRLRVIVDDADRILLDTSVVRKLIYGDLDGLDVANLIRLKGDHPVSIADGALAELADALLRGSIPHQLWASRIQLLDDLLDGEFPVAPGGKELASFWGAVPRAGVDRDESRAYYTAAWRLLRLAKSGSDLHAAHYYTAPSGKRYAMTLDPTHVRRVLAEEGRRWEIWVQAVARVIGSLRDDGERITVADLSALTMGMLVGEMGLADAERLDLVVRVLAHHAFCAAATRTPYDPKGRSNDALDLDLLYGIPLPAWVCTSDLRLHRLVRLTGSNDQNRVMTPAELIARLAAEQAGSAGPLL